MGRTTAVENEFFTEAVRSLLPLYSQEHENDPVAKVKFFAPWTSRTWYAIEFDGEDLGFGLVDGNEEDFGYFSLKELASVRGPGGLRVERDQYYRPTRVSELRRA